MSHTNIHHRRTHNLLLISKLLNQRDAPSPFTLVLDSLEQPAPPLVREYLRRANVAKTNTIFLAWETVRAPAGAGHFVACHDKTPGDVAGAVAEVVRASSAKRHLIIIDSLHSLCTLSLRPETHLDLTGYLSSLLAPQSNAQNLTPPATTTLVAVYHADIPMSHDRSRNMYAPSPLALLTYLSTTILTLHPLSHLLSAQHHNSRSQEPPPYGLDEHKAGVVIGLKPSKWTRQLQPRHRGLVMELEHRRKSGRGVREWYFLPSMSESPGAGIMKENVILLDDHPLFRARLDDDRGEGGGGLGDLGEMTFELGLTERQRLERDGVVLPYFDAQKGGGAGGPGEGGRILYDMGVEDDFDEEEDEI